MIQSYFTSEKKAAFGILALGLITCTIGFTSLIGALPPFYVGLALPFVIIGIIQVFVGTTVARRSDFQAIDLQKMLGDNPEEFVQLESPRMGKVMRNFVLIRRVEGAFIIIGVALILLNPGLVFSMGLGTGLGLQGVIMLVFDYFAEKRSEKYSAFVDSIQD